MTIVIKNPIVEKEMPAAIDVACFFIRLAAGEDEPELLTHLRLQALLYYAQGWSLALRDRPLFGEKIEAWPHGPVVKDVYPCFAGYGNHPIPVEKLPDSGDLEDDDCELVGSVWEAYKGYSALGLREKIHNERPWVEARGTLGPAARSDREITREVMSEYFKSLAET